MSIGKEWSDAEFEELRAVFFAQAYELVADLQDLLMTLETEPGNADAVRTIKRHIHTLKGDSHAMGISAAGALCHRMEDVLSPALEDKSALEPEGVELLLRAVEAMRGILLASEARQETGSGNDVIAGIDRYLGTTAPRRTAAPLPDSTGAALSEYQALQVRSAREEGLSLFEVLVTLDPLCAEPAVGLRMVLKQLETAAQVIRSVPEPDSPAADHARTLQILLSTRAQEQAIERQSRIAGITAGVRIAAFTETPVQFAAGNRDQAPVRTMTASQSGFVRVEASRVDRIMDLVGELIIGRSMMEQTARDMEQGLSTEDAAARLLSVNAYLDRTVSDLKKAVMKMRMVPINQVFRKFPKMVRDLVAEKGKHVRVELFGRETELDKGIVDALGEPLAHIIRNLVDHGIETPAERQAAGKPEEGAIVLRAFQQGSHFIVEASDDGRGINPAKVKLKAVEMGFLPAADAENLADRAAMELIFLPGLSTADTVSGTSGRGVGMDAVRAAIEALKGTIEIESSSGRGTLFRLRLPLTLAVIKALLFTAGDQEYALPVSVIAEVARVNEDALTTVDGRTTLLLRDRVISAIDLRALFGGAGDGQGKYALILGTGGGKTAILIDRLLWQQELVIKAVDAELVPTPCVAGASILGDGKVVLILDEQALLGKAIREDKARMASV